MTQSDFNPIAFLEQMLRIPSVSGQEGEVARFLVQQMQALGFHSYVDGAGNAVGERGEGPDLAGRHVSPAVDRGRGGARHCGLCQRGQPRGGRERG